MKHFYSALLCLPWVLGYTQSTTGVDSMSFKDLDLKVYSDGTIMELRKNGANPNSLVFAHQIWLQGLDNQSQYGVAAQVYGTIRPDFVPGPVSTDPNATTSYNRVWKVDAAMITDFINGSSTIPEPILNWPAHGNTQFGEAQDLAPFVDVDNDNIYDPQNGDYPCIPGDVAIFFMFNDLNNLATDMGVEVHGMVYGMDQGGYLDSTIFIDYKIYNRSTKSFTDCAIGVFSDFDIGDAGDDVIGTEVGYSTIYAYNGDENDISAVGGFGKSLGSAAMVWLKGPNAPYFDAIDNDRDLCLDGIVGPTGNCLIEDPVAGINENWQLSNSITFGGATTSVNPENNPLLFDFFLNGRCENGMEKELPGSGDGFWGIANPKFDCLGGGLNPVMDFVYTGNSSDASATFSPTADRNWFQSPSDGGDMRTFGGSGHFNLPMGQATQLNIAYCWHQADTAQSKLDAGIGGLLARVKKIKDDFGPQTDHANNCKQFSIGLDEEATRSFEYFYNSSDRRIELINKSGKELRIEAFDLTGRHIARWYMLPGVSKAMDVSSKPTGLWILRDMENGSGAKLMIH